MMAMPVAATSASCSATSRCSHSWNRARWAIASSDDSAPSGDSASSSLFAFHHDVVDGSIAAMRSVPTDLLREELLVVHGVGPETADSILNYALDKPALVVDAYTHRIWTRHGWIDADVDYHALQEEVARGVSNEPQVYNEFHALLVNVGHHWCKRTPKCDGCPLQELLPAGGPQC